MVNMLFPNNPKFALIDHPARLYKLNETYGGHTVWVWGDDPDGFAFGGNKVRFYEYLIPRIIDSKASTIVTSGSLYSNHVRVSAEVAKRLGLDCHLFITADKPSDEFLSAQNNVTMAEKLGAKIIYGGSFAAMLKIEEYKKQLAEVGTSYFHVPNAGHDNGAIRAYADVTVDALSKLFGLNVNPERIFVPCASGTTAAGVMEGCALIRHEGMPAPSVTAFRVGNSQKGAERGVRELLDHALEFTGAVSVDEPVDVRDCGKNAYGCPDDELLALRDSVYRENGLLLDRTYNINAFYGMINYLEQNPGKTDVLYIHTGGWSK